MDVRAATVPLLLILAAMISSPGVEAHTCTGDTYPVSTCGGCDDGATHNHTRTDGSVFCASEVRNPIPAPPAILAVLLAATPWGRARAKAAQALEGLAAWIERRFPPPPETLPHLRDREGWGRRGRSRP